MNGTEFCLKDLPNNTRTQIYDFLDCCRVNIQKRDSIDVILKFYEILIVVKLYVNI